MSGASGDAGVEYRRGVAAYAVTCGLAGVPLRICELGDAHAGVDAVILETDDPVDDVRVEFKGGRTAYLQAKRSLTKGEPLSKALAQWVKAAQRGLDPLRQRLVIVTGKLDEKLRPLQEALARYKQDEVGKPTRNQAAALRDLDDLMLELTQTQRELVRRCGVIHELRVEQPSESDAIAATERLGHLLVLAETAPTAWNELLTLVGLAARRRGGFYVRGWVDALAGRQVHFSAEGQSPSAIRERERQALDRYRRRLRYRGEHLELRGLQINIPALRLADADAVVHVRGKDSPTSEDLLWAFLREGRAIVTGLPGGGKSTELRRVASRLLDLEDAPLAVYASLADIDSLSLRRNFRDRLLDIVVQDTDDNDRQMLREEIDRLLTQGEIALLVDSLDETYDRRGEVVAEIESFLTGVSADTPVLLATRDVAYGQASTLRWPTLQLQQPAEPGRLVNALLSELAITEQVPASQRERWVAHRAGWVERRLSENPQLKETPLLLVLMAQLTQRGTANTLPSSRAAVLRAVIIDMFTRRESKRHQELLGSLRATSAQARANVALRAFQVEACAILDAQGRIQAQELQQLVALDLRDRRALPPDEAADVAANVVRFLDEAGVFVIQNDGQTVAPRILLLAEVGDAMRACETPEALGAWVERRLTGGQLEPVILAAALSPVAANALGETASSSDDREVLHAAAAAYGEGAQLSQRQLTLIASRLIGILSHGDVLSWKSWQPLLSLPLSQDLRDHIVEAAAKHSPAHAVFAAATLDLLWRSFSELCEHPAHLLAVLKLDAIRHAPITDRLVGFGEDVRSRWDLARCQYQAAEAILDAIPEAEDLVMVRAEHWPDEYVRQLRSLARTRGLSTLSSRLPEEARWTESVIFKAGGEISALLEGKLLNQLSSKEVSPLNLRQRTRLTELAELLDIMRLGEVSSIHLLRWHEAHLRSVIELVAALHHLDLIVLAAQVALLRQRMTWSGNADPLWALLHSVESDREADWSQVVNAKQAVETLLELYFEGQASAWVAARCLVPAPPQVAQVVTPRVRDVLVELESSPRNMTIAAETLCLLTKDGPEPQCWLESADPVLRSALARECGRRPAELGDELAILLEDPDGNVRADAIKSAYSQRPPRLRELLETQAAAGPTGWTCLNCRTLNAPGITACAKTGCMLAAPTPARTAADLLDKLDVEQTETANWS